VENLESEWDDRRDGLPDLNDAAWPWIAVLATVAEFLSLVKSMVGGEFVGEDLVESGFLEGGMVVLEKARSLTSEGYRDTCDVAGLVILVMV
jgi:hypothetical protein